MATVRYARTSDGVDIAYAVTGTGPPLLVARPLIREAVDRDLEEQLDTELPFLAKTRRIVIWDARGFGLSQTKSPEYTLDSSLLDLTAVADALKLHTFDLLAHLTPAHAAIAFAARYPERVSRLALWNPSQPGHSPRTDAMRDLSDLISTHFREYMQLSALRFFGWDRPQIARRWVSHMLNQFTSETWLRTVETMEQVDALSEAPSVQCPTLVIVDHRTLDKRSERPEAIRRIAAIIPNSELVVLKGDALGYGQAVEEFLSRDQQRPEAELPGITAILFADIADSTALTERLGDKAFRQKARDLDAALRKTIRDHSGTCIDAKTLGDGVLATFASAAKAIESALACGKAGADVALPLHLGLHAGDVIREENNVFGGAVNIAARISGLSAAGELLVSDTVRSLARTSAGVTFEDRGEQSLKGVGEPVRVFAVREQSS